MNTQLPFQNYLFGSFLLIFLISFNGNDLVYRLTTSRTSILVDTIPPTAICLKGLFILKIPITGCVTIHVKELDGGSYDDLTPLNKLKFYFDKTRKNDSIQICCDDFAAAGANDELFVELQMWVEDEVGNSSFCLITVIIQDNQDICEGGDPTYGITGKVESENADYVICKSTLTGPNGFKYERNSNEISFTYLFNKGGYFLCLEKNEEYRNGVSTADVVKIKRHILGIETLNSPYKIMAADVNNSQAITATDATEIRRLILGLKNEFSNAPSWIFVPKNLTFAQNIVPNIRPFIPSCDSIHIIDQSISDLNYIAIKMGDVNGSAKGHDLINAQKRNQNQILCYQTKLYGSNSSKTAFKLKDDLAISGMQFTLSFDPTEYEFIKIKNGNIQIDDDQFSLHEIDKGKIHLAWDRNPLENISSTSGTLFSIIWKKKTSAASEMDLRFDTQGVQALLIDPELNEIDLTLQSSNPNSNIDFTIYQDFNNQTIQIEGLVYKESIATYSILDITGRVIFQKSIQLNEGLFHENISTTALSVNALYFFKLQSGQNSKILKFFNPK